MQSVYICIITFLAIVATNPTLAVVHQLNLTYTSGILRTYWDDQPELPGYADLATYVCRTGLWVVYTELSFTGNGFVQIYPTIEEFCEPTIMMNIGSARTVGNDFDNEVPSVALFSSMYLEDEVLETDNSLSRLQFPIYSLITVETNVEVFSEYDFQGDSFCVEIDPYYCRNGICWMWKWEYTFNSPWDGTLAKSARIGCTHAHDLVQASMDAEHPWPATTNYKY